MREMRGAIFPSNLLCSSDGFAYIIANALLSYLKIHKWPVRLQPFWAPFQSNIKPPVSFPAGNATIIKISHTYKIGVRKKLKKMN